MITASTRRTSYSILALLLLSTPVITNFIITSPAHGGQAQGSNDSQLFCLADNCTTCHDRVFALLDGENSDTFEEYVDISFVKAWETTMMRFSFLDPFWRAKVRSESMTLPGLTDAIEDKCSRCHAPMANVQATADGQAIHVFGAEGFIDPDSTYHDLAMQGVSCTLCHQIMDPEETTASKQTLSTSYLNSGTFEITEDHIAWSKYYPDYAQAMSNASGFTPQFAEHPTQSAFCATCHDLYTDYFSAAGEKQSSNETQFPEQTPYQEWLASDFSKAKDPVHCQDCHMTAFPKSIISRIPNGTQLRENVYQHSFLTENTMMLNIIASLADDKDIDESSINDAVQEGQDYLTTAGTIEVSDISWDEGELVVQVRVSNLAGHKLPTSIPVRRVFIHFAVYAGDTTDPARILFSSGDTNEDGGIIGVDDVVQEAGYEPHHNVITMEDEVQVYEAIMQTFEGELTTTLLRAASFKKDNRILPLGWKPTGLQKLLNPVGEASSDPDFIGGEDTIEYRLAELDLSPYQTATIEVELKDQTLSYPMAQALKPYASDETVAAFLNEYEEHKVHFELIDNDVVTFATDNSSN